MYINFVEWTQKEVDVAFVNWKHGIADIFTIQYKYEMSDTFSQNSANFLTFCHLQPHLANVPPQRCLFPPYSKSVNPENGGMLPERLLLAKESTLSLVN